MERLKELRKTLHSIETVSELLEQFTPRRLERFSFVLLVILVLSPLYAMGWSLFFGRHTDEAYIANLLGLGSAWHTLLIQIGYIGVIVAIILFAKSVDLARKNGIRPADYMKQHVVEIFLFLFIFWTVLATVFSINPSLSLKGDFYRREGLWTYGAYLGIFALAKTQTRLNIVRLVSLFVGVGALLGVLDMMDVDAINRVFTLKKKTSIFHNANHYGYYLVMGVMANALLILNLRTLKSPLAVPLLIFHGLFAAVVINNHSFGAFIALFATFIIVLLLVLWLKRKLFLRTLLLAVMFLLVSWFQSLADDYLASEVSNTREDVANIIENNEDASSGGTGRWSLWVNGVSFALEKPLFGYGPDTLGVPYEDAGNNTDRPHNEPVQFAASQGIPALIFYLAAVTSLAVMAFRKRHALSVLTLTLGFVVIGYLASSMFGNTMYYTTPFYVMSLALTLSRVKATAYQPSN
ncbi:MAG: O-antigen ligase family protein [Bacillota bacterium]